MSRVVLRSRRGRWLLGFFACAVLTLGVLLFGGRRVKVTVYNDTDEPWTRATLTVGKDARYLTHLPLHQGGATEVFSPTETAAAVELTAENSRVIHWSAPYLVQGDTASVTLHVDRWGAVTATVEQRLSSRLAKIIE